MGQIRETCKELIEDGDYPNAQNLYSRVFALYKNMTKKMRDGLSEEQKLKREEALHLLCVNLSVTHFKRNNFKDAIKCAKESLDFNKERPNPKAHYRLAMALKANGELDDAKDQIIAAIKLSPGDASLREELKKLKDLKQTKEQEWYSKMNGFYSSKKMQDIERREEEQAILKDKLEKQFFPELQQQ